MVVVYTRLSQLAGTDINPQVLNYAERVRLSGHLVSLQYTKVLNTFLTASYSDGFGGDGTVFEFIEKFDLLWIPGSFGEITIPLIGTDLTNEGFSQNEFQLTTGLQGNLTSTLLTSIKMSDLDPSDSHISCGADVGSIPSFRPVIGAYDGESFIGLAREATATAICEFGNAKIRFTNTNTSSLFTMNLTENDTLRYYHNSTLKDLPGSLATRSSSSLPIRLFGRSEPTFVRHGSHSSGFASIGKALTVQEINVLSNAVLAFRANKFALANA
jgi:hypothetical protein